MDQYPPMYEQCQNYLFLPFFYRHAHEKIISQFTYGPHPFYTQPWHIFRHSKHTNISISVTYVTARHSQTLIKTVSKSFRSFARSFHDWYFKCNPQLPDTELQNTGNIILKDETWIRTEDMKSINSRCNVTLRAQDRSKILVTDDEQTCHKIYYLSSHIMSESKVWMAVNLMTTVQFPEQRYSFLHCYVGIMP